MSTRGGQTHWAVIAGAVAVATAVGVAAGALLFGSSDTKSSTTTVTADPRPINLPANLAGFRDVTEVMASHHGNAATLKRQRENQARVRSETEAAYRRAFGGAGAAYRQYSDSGLQKLVYVIAVRAPAPGLTLGPVLDASYLGLATPEREVKTVGDVSCQIVWSPPTVAGRTPPPSSERVATCQRSDSGVTAFTGAGSFAGPADLQAMAAITNAAWNSARGG